MKTLKNILKEYRRLPQTDKTTEEFIKETTLQIIDEMIEEVEQLIEMAGTNRQLDVALPVVEKIVQELKKYKEKFFHKK